MAPLQIHRDAPLEELIAAAMEALHGCDRRLRGWIEAVRCPDGGPGCLWALNSTRAANVGASGYVLSTLRGMGIFDDMITPSQCRDGSAWINSMKSEDGYFLDPALVKRSPPDWPAGEAFPSPAMIGASNGYAENCLSCYENVDLNLRTRALKPPPEWPTAENPEVALDWVKSRPWDRNPWGAGSHSMRVAVALLQWHLEGKIPLHYAIEVLRYFYEIADPETGLYGAADVPLHVRLNGVFKVFVLTQAQLDLPLPWARKLVDIVLTQWDDPHFDERVDGCYDGLTGWSGLYRSVWIERVPRTHLTEVHVLPSAGLAQAVVRVRWRGRRLPADRALIVCRVVPDNFNGCAYEVSAPPSADGRSAEIPVAMPEGKRWDIDTPNLYRAEVSLQGDGGLVDRASVRFGLREIRADGHRILLNDRPVFLRGACDDVLYPETVMPPAEKSFHAARLARAKEFGFNYTKSCVEVFFREHLDAADELGFLVCQEMPFGLRAELRERRYRPTAPFERLWRAELGNIVRSSRSHPSVIAYAMASEMSTLWNDNKRCFHFFSRELPSRTRRLAPDALVVDNTGASRGPHVGRHAVPLRIRHGLRDTDLQGSWLRWAYDCRPLLGTIPGMRAVRRPYIFHEYAWITSLSDPDLPRRYQGLPVMPLHVPEMIAAAQTNGQEDALEVMVDRSRQLKHALRKHAFEVARREPKAAGYHHWLIHDFPFCAEGVFNEFWEAPADLVKEDFLSYNGDTVLCLEDGGRRWYAADETPRVRIVISHFGQEPVRNALMCKCSILQIVLMTVAQTRRG